MVVIDTTILMLVFRRDVPRRLSDNAGNVIDHAQERIDYLVKNLEALKSTIVIPTPVLSELLVGIGPQETQSILEEIRKARVFRVEPFETKAAIEVALMTRNAKAAGDKKGGIDAPWAKVKFDRQIVAVAKVVQASAIYTDDSDIISIAKLVNIPTIGLADLELPPETAQGVLPLEQKNEPSDEIAIQSETLKEPEVTDEPPTIGTPPK
jgi:predicted nucleic acid-binding protein